MMKMTKRFILCIAAVALLASCNTDWIRPSGNVIFTERMVGNFDALVVANGLNVTVTMGNGSAVTVTADDNIQPYIETFTDGGTLYVKIRRHTSFRGNPAIRVGVSATQLGRISASDGSRVRLANRLDAEALSIGVSDGCHFGGELSVTGAMDMRISDGSRVEITGTCSDFLLNISDGSSFTGFGLSAESVRANVSDGSSVEVAVENFLEVNVSDGSVFRYRGNPSTFSQTVSDGSKVEKVG